MMHVSFKMIVLLAFSVLFLPTTFASSPVSTPILINSQIKTYPVQPAFGEPVRGLSLGEWKFFKIGEKSAFNKDFDQSTGLGPIFNSQRCSFCHNDPVGGGSAPGFGASVHRFGQDNNGIFDPLTNLGGSLLQANTISANPLCREQIPTLPNMVQAIRSTPGVFGSGLIEAIADRDILVKANNPPPGISGAAHWVQPLEGGSQRVGRFGWKAQVATVLTFSADALVNEAGVTNDLALLENTPNSFPGDPAVLAVCDDGVADPDDRPDAQGYRVIDRLTHYQSLLAAPPQTPLSGMQGETIFDQIGCMDCHRRQFKTSAAAATPLAGKKIHPYSDFLLHDMGAFGDGIVQGQAQAKEMKTPPLWGVGYRKILLHDASADALDFRTRIEQAITAHAATGSEAQAAAFNYFALSNTDKLKVVSFLASLGRREFDFDNNRIVDQSDFTEFRNCYQGSQNYTADDSCAVFDVNQDQVVNTEDLNAFATVYPGPIADCNCNGTLDLQEILNGVADLNNDLSPDACHKSLNLAAQTFTSQPGFLWTFSSVTGAPAGSQVTFYYGFSEQGNGGTYGDAVCLNVKTPLILGTVTANASGVATLQATVPVPTTAQNITFQAGYPGNNGVGALKSQVLKFEIDPI